MIPQNIIKSVQKEAKKFSKSIIQQIHIEAFKQGYEMAMCNMVEFAEYCEKYFARPHENDGTAGAWYSLDDLLMEEPLTTENLLMDYLQTKTKNPEQMSEVHTNEK